MCVFVPDTSQLPWEQAGAEGPISQVRIPGEGRKGAHDGRWPGWKANLLPGRLGKSRWRGQRVRGSSLPCLPAPILSTPLTHALLSLGRQAVFPLTVTFSGVRLSPSPSTKEKQLLSRWDPRSLSPPRRGSPPLLHSHVPRLPNRPLGLSSHPAVVTPPRPAPSSPKLKQLPGLRSSHKDAASPCPS